jgi:hypothetical protein
VLDTVAGLPEARSTPDAAVGYETVGFAEVGESPPAMAAEDGVAGVATPVALPVLFATSAWLAFESVLVVGLALTLRLGYALMFASVLRARVAIALAVTATSDACGRDSGAAAELAPRGVGRTNIAYEPAASSTSVVETTRMRLDTRRVVASRGRSSGSTPVVSSMTCGPLLSGVAVGCAWESGICHTKTGKSRAAGRLSRVIFSYRSYRLGR